MSKPKSLEEMEAIRQKESILREQEIRTFVPEKNESKGIALFEISRYIKGGFKGLFLVHEVITHSGDKKLKVPIRKTVAEGVDMVVAMSSLETSLRRKVFR